MDTKQETQLFRPIHYLGSKLRILDFIENTIDQIDPLKKPVCDLFAGSGTVSFKLSQNRSVFSVDIQEYSKVICEAILNPRATFQMLQDLIKETSNSNFTLKLRQCMQPLIDYEEECVQQALIGENDQLCDLLENGSLISHQLYSDKGSSKINTLIRSALKEMETTKLSNSIDSISTRYFGGIYFSYAQAVEIDALLFQIHLLPVEYKNTFLSCLLSSVSDLVNTVGKQFAQPIRPRDRFGAPKKNIGLQVKKDRSQSLLKTFEEWGIKYLDIPVSNFTHSFLKMDFSDALDSIPNDVSTIYADPPYTRDHYSRYYHVLETLCLRDNPNISTNVISSGRIISRGLYREQRHQSPFCIKSQAPIAFDNLFSKAANKQTSLLLSYSPYDETKQSHPRLMTMPQLIDLSKKYYRQIDVLNPGLFAHSKLTNSEKHLHTSDFGELLIVCTQPY